MPRVALPLLLLPLLVACASIKGIGESESALLSDAEREVVRGQVERAREDGRWPEAWNQEIDAGADRERLEQIAIDALEDGAAEARGMFEELYAKWPALTPDGRAGVRRLVGAAVAERDWNRAVDIELAAADDAPAFAAAFGLYEDAPPHKAPDMLERIKRAREDAERE